MAIDPSKLKSKVLFAQEEDEIGATIQTMVEHEVGSVLVTDQEDNITGIITERDIVRKFTMIDLPDKLTRNVRTFMTRPVHFAHVDSIEEDMLELFKKFNLRHFPIVDDKAAKKDHVVGMVSVTDLIHRYLIKNQTPKAAKEETHINLGVMSKSPKINAPYKKMFEKIGYEIEPIEDFHKFAIASPEANLLWDMDGYSQKQLQELIPAVKSFGGKLILATSNSQLEAIFRSHLDRTKQVVMIKPLNISYCHWLLTLGWERQK